MKLEQRIEQAVKLLAGSHKCVALTGAGVSTESGIPDFRGASGLWSRFDPLEYGTIGAFRRDPEKVWRMLSELIDIADARPNPGHLAMAELEEMGILKGIITQNIDGLHQKAGSRHVVEFHGSTASFTCQSCHKEFRLAAVRKMDVVPRCTTCREVLKPDVVFFDEQIPAVALQRSGELLADVDVLLVAGTSCQARPASFIPEQVHSQGGRIIELNLEPALGSVADIVLCGGFSRMMTSLVHHLKD